MEKHGGEKRQGRGYANQMLSRMGYHIGEGFEMCDFVGDCSHFIYKKLEPLLGKQLKKKGADIDSDDKHCHIRKCVCRIFVFEWNEHYFSLEIQVMNKKCEPTTARSHFLFLP